MIFDNLDEIKKTATPADWWTKYFLHPFSIRLASLLKDTKVTPNHLTLLSTTLVFLTFPLICWSSYFLTVLAAFTLQFSLLLDCADGQLARVKKSSSSFGEWLDRGTDRVKDFLIIFALTFRYSEINNSAWTLGFICFFIVYFIDFLGLQAKLSPILPREEDIIDEKEKNFVRKLKRFKRKIGLGFFQIGEQYLLYTAFLILDKIDWLFYSMIAYGSLSIVWTIFNTCRESGLLDK